MYSSQRLVDLDEMILSCRTLQAKEYISEAVSCYRAGAHRAVIVNTWIAIVFDLIDKVRELAISGDGTAKTLLDEFENYQKQIDQGNEQAIKSALDFERNILKIAKDKFQFFDNQQFLDLSRLREDRHRCAHPSFHRIEDPYKPSAEQARMHLRNAIFHVLSQEPVQGKAAIDKIITVISSKYFPKETDKAIIQLKSSEFSNPNIALVKGVIDRLVFGYFEEQSPLHYNMNTIVAITAILSMRRDIAEQRLFLQLNKLYRIAPDDKLIWVILMSLRIPEAWSGLDAASKEKVITFIDTAPDTDVVPMFKVALRHPELEIAAKNRILSFDLEALSDGILNYEYGGSAVKRAIQLYTKAENWDTANLIFEKAIRPLFNHFTKDNIKEIIKSPKENKADLPGSHGFSSFLTEIRSSNLLTNDELNDMLDEYDLSRYKK